MLTVANIRKELSFKYLAKDFVIDRTGAKTIEMIGATFIADQDYVIRKPAYKYIERELEWSSPLSVFIASSLYYRRFR